MALSLIGYSSANSYSSNWRSIDLTMTASGEELWVIFLGVYDDSAGCTEFTIDGTAMNNWYKNGSIVIGWAIVSNGSHTCYNYINNGSPLVICGTRWSGYAASPYLGTNYGQLYYGTSLPFIDTDLDTDPVGGALIAAIYRHSDQQHPTLGSGQTSIFSYDGPRPCDGHTTSFDVCYLPAANGLSDPDRCYWTYSDYDQQHYASEYSFSSGDAAPEIRKYRRTRWNNYPYRRDRLGPMNIGGGAVGKGLWTPPGYNQVAVAGRPM